MKIKNATIEHLLKQSTASRDYSDGPIEDSMLELVQSPDFSEKRAAMLANKPSWAMFYHFTPLRGNIINWKKFSPNTKILEIGAGCGAITEALLAVVDDSVTVDALELSEKRALINAHRNKKYKNLRVIVGNLEEFTETGYDYIVCIGVLEYAGKFISGEDPFMAFLEKLNGFLKPGGELLLAIENKLGTKYINGAREDHNGKYYESIMGYPQYNGVRTFSKKELTSLFSNAGFKKLEFFLPIPDYKIPTMIINESLLNVTDDLSFISRAAPAPAYDQSRIYSFSEQLFTRSIIDAGLYAELSNSFLIRGEK